MEHNTTRPCVAKGNPCLFHRWIDEDKALLKINAFVRAGALEEEYKRYKDDGIIPPFGEIKIVRMTFALIELPDGSMAKVDPESIKFIKE